MAIININLCIMDLENRIKSLVTGREVSFEYYNDNQTYNLKTTTYNKETDVTFTLYIATSDIDDKRILLEQTINFLEKSADEPMVTYDIYWHKHGYPHTHSIFTDHSVPKIIEKFFSTKNNYNYTIIEMTKL